MGAKTGISWTEATWNPLRGCVRVSEGCRFCYAEGVAARFSGPEQPYEGLARMVDTPKGSEARWTGALKLVPDMLEQPLRWKRPRMIFVNSMSDLFWDKVPLHYIDEVVAVMALAPQHTFQVLTKRADRMRDYLNDSEMPKRVLVHAERLSTPRRLIPQILRVVATLGSGKPLPNVWWGVSAENQEAANERVPALLSAKAAVRFVSYEPALGAIDFGRIVENGDDPDAYWYIDALRGALWDDANGLVSTDERDVPALNWIIVGGESHQDRTRARPFNVNWARDLIVASQQDGARTAIYVKQLGSNPEGPLWNRDGIGVKWKSGKWDDPSAWPEELQVQNFPEAANAHQS